MPEIVCQDCGWQGHPDDLIAIATQPKSTNDFVHCPKCTGTEFAEVLVDYKPAVQDGE